MYDLHKLGWNSFQQLCLTVTSEILGQTVESFLDNRDGGRDGAFTGTWKAVGQESLSGPFVIQCKFTSKVNRILRPSDLSDEVKKARRLVERGLCESYVLMTNAGISGTGSASIKDAFKAVGVRFVAIYGGPWINRQILENKRLRMLVPRVYGLGDLSQILDERAYAQARAILESMREDLAKVVVTDAYRKAVAALDKHSFVLLIGEPAAGKTTIASLLAMAAIDQWDVSPIKLDGPELVVERWNPQEPTQFFWLDDAFGVTQYEVALVQRWNHNLPRVSPMLAKGAKVVMTSRDYIYNRARWDLKQSAFPLLEESQVVIDVQNLAVEEKRQILYNHLRLGKQSRSFLTRIKPYLERVARHDRFIPEIARRLAEPLFTRNLSIDESDIDQFVEQREQLSQEVLRGLDVDSKGALALLYMRNGRLESPVELQVSEQQALDRLGSDLGGCVAALEALRDTFVVLTMGGGEAVWEFRHPTVADAYGKILVQSTEHLEIFIKGSAPDRLIRQVTCGDVGIENAVVVPKSLLRQMLLKLEEYSERRLDSVPSFGARHNLLYFLARRCSKEFLSLYLEHNPDVFPQGSDLSLPLYAGPEVPLAERLHEYGLLPEEYREDLVEWVSNYALQGIDGGALHDQRIQSLFTDDEFADFLQRVRTEVLSELDDIRWDWESSFSRREGSPEGYMDEFLRTLKALKAWFAYDERSVRLLNHQVSLTRQWIEENTYDEDKDRHLRRLGAVQVPEELRGTRSIFDDVDAN